jgi:hypothetical protein
MRNVRWAWGAAALAGAALVTGVGMASGVVAPAEDDLAVVKRAVAQSAPPADKPAAARTEGQPLQPETARAQTPRQVRTGKEPTWLKVRVTDKESGRRKVTVNVPIALVRAFDDGFPIDFGCHGEYKHRCSIRVGDVLDALEAGQDLVEVDDEHELVRIWVE